MTVFLCGPQAFGWVECCCCGGSATLGGTQDSIPGSVPSLVYCSTECHDSWEDFLATEAERRALRLATCPGCGFDNQEHAEDCVGNEDV